MPIIRAEGEEGVTAIATSGGPERGWPVWQIIDYLNQFTPEDEAPATPNQVDETALRRVADFISLDPPVIEDAIRYWGEHREEIDERRDVELKRSHESHLESDTD